MTREQYIEALEAGCTVHVNGYAIRRDGPVFRISREGYAPDGWHVDAAGALRLVGS